MNGYYHFCSSADEDVCCVWDSVDMSLQIQVPSATQMAESDASKRWKSEEMSLLPLCLVTPTSHNALLALDYLARYFASTCIIV
jgi:hypothetical protein